MNVRLYSAAILGSVCVLVGAGCQPNPRGPIGAGADMTSRQTDPAVTIDQDLAPYVVVRYNDIKVSGGDGTRPMQVAVPVRLTSDQGTESRIQYKFEFFDANDVPLRVQMGWKYQVLPSRNEVVLQGTAMDTIARKWRMSIRLAR
ncbi:MAG: DUF1425 domain-containing protein [Planctomycetota bacterium]|nr:DUF1425 domain-containing protein [Planctomycetota bacterium]